MPLKPYAEALLALNRMDDEHERNHTENHVWLCGKIDITQPIPSPLLS